MCALVLAFPLPSSFAWGAQAQGQWVPPLAPLVSFVKTYFTEKTRRAMVGALEGHADAVGSLQGRFPGPQWGPGALTQRLTQLTLWGHGIDPLCSRFWSVRVVKHLILPIASWHLARRWMELTNWHGGISFWESQTMPRRVTRSFRAYVWGLAENKQY